MSTEEASWPAQPAPIKKTVAWSEGRICDLADARVPLEDRGVLFGEAVYEAMLTRRGVAFAEESHLRRLAASAAGAGIDFAAAEPAVRDAIAALIAAGGEGDGLLYLQVTGGVAPRDHVPPSSGLTPGVYATLRPFDHMALGEAQRAGIAVVTMPDPRWSGARFKTTQLLGNVMGKRAAVAGGAAEVLFTVDDEALEGGSSNLFVVRDGIARTPPLDRNILPGITRALLLEHAAEVTEEAPLLLDDLKMAEEVFITSTTRPVLGVTKVDGVIIGDGTPGSVTTRLASVMEALFSSACAG